MKQCLAFVLGGGGARGALQLGALRALLNADIVPDLLVGTSIGAVNAVGLALCGPDLSALETLEWAYQEIWDNELMDPNVRRVALRGALGRPNEQASRRVAEVLVESGITPDVRFDQARVRLAVVGANLDTGQPVIYGQDPSQSVMDGLLASIAVPPWFAPIEKDSETIIDGGFVSNLPIEAAVALGATEIIALDLDDPRPRPGKHPPIDRFLDKLLFTVTQRQKQLETALAQARGVPVRCMELRGPKATAIWDFENYRELIQTGYEIGCRKIAEWANSDQAPASTPGGEELKGNVVAAESQSGSTEVSTPAPQQETIGTIEGTNPAGRGDGKPGAAIQSSIKPLTGQAADIAAAVAPDGERESQLVRAEHGIDELTTELASAEHELAELRRTLEELQGSGEHNGD